MLSEKQFSEIIQKKIPLSNEAYKIHLSKNLQSNKLENSSVLVIVYYNQMNVPVIIFTKRSSKLRNHAGEISFPGGRM